MIYSAIWDQIRRLKVDQENTSFSANKQFKIYHEFSIPTTQVAIYKFTGTFPLNLLQRRLQSHNGELLTYRVHPSTGSEVFTETWTDITDSVRPVNNILTRPDITEHPASGHTAEVFIGAASSLTGLADAADGIVAGGGGGQPGSAFNSDFTKLGYGAGTVYTIVTNEGNNTATGSIFLAWEILTDV